MATKWKSTSFSASESVVGHGRESIGRLICDFLNENGIKEGSAMVSVYPDTDFYGKPVVHAILFYKK